MTEQLPQRTAKDYEVGQTVEVFAMGHWYGGTVVKVGPSRVTVRYTSGAGKTRDKAVNPTAACGGFERGVGPVDGPGVRPMFGGAR